jgi:hypothetical protein
MKDDLLKVIIVFVFGISIGYCLNILPTSKAATKELTLDEKHMKVVSMLLMTHQHQTDTNLLFNHQCTMNCPISRVDQINTPTNRIVYLPKSVIGSGIR